MHFSYGDRLASLIRELRMKEMNEMKKQGKKHIEKMGKKSWILIFILLEY